ncbi:hypothetical protein [Streptomyces sp. NPDC058985]|uniref:hypothetical protein n=1 Tax=Streptomyces sp. NPDC058985 TaxID=3346684 RepID=UPI0036AC63D1
MAGIASKSANRALAIRFAPRTTDRRPRKSAKGAAAIIERAGLDESPLRQLLGSHAHAYATAKVDALRANLDATAASAATTDFPDV